MGRRCGGKMYPYEVMFILRPDLDEEVQTASIEKVSRLISDGGGTVEKVDKWGKRKLAYEVKGYREGLYVVTEFQGTPELAKELDRVLKISDEVIRGLIVRRDES